ncbi:MAG: SRPBCC family protein, partial [Chloroflexota bacterium]
MPSNDYHFITTWRVKGTIEEIFDIIGSPLELARWWPSVYLEVQELEPGDPVTHVGRVIDLYTKGWLPYTLRWQFRVTEVDRPHRMALDPRGDFLGYGVWTFHQEGEWARVVYEWKVAAQKPLLRNLSFLFKPIFSANHRWAMRMGEESLKLELARRHAATDEERA